MKIHLKILFLLFTALFLMSSCDDRRKKAEALFVQAQEMYEKAEYASAKQMIDSIHTNYRGEIDVLKASLRLMRNIEKKETERNIAFCDSMIPVRMHERDSLIKGFNFEKDPKYNDIGMYIWKTQTIERNIQRCYIRSGVNEEGRMYLASVFYGGKGLGHTGLRVSTPDGLYAETPAVAYDGGKNFRFTDMGATTEVVTYDGENCEDAVKFIYSNRNERIKAEYTGGKPYFIYILDGDKQAVCKTFELAMVLNDIQKMNELKKKSAHRIAYLNQKLLQPTK